MVRLDTSGSFPVSCEFIEPFTLVIISHYCKTQLFIMIFFYCTFNPRVNVWIIRWVFLCWLLQDLGVRLLSWLLEDECLCSLVFSRSRGDFHLNAPVSFALYTLEMYFLHMACVIYMVSTMNKICLFLKFDSFWNKYIFLSESHWILWLWMSRVTKSTLAMVSPSLLLALLRYVWRMRWSNKIFRN